MNLKIKIQNTDSKLYKSSNLSIFKSFGLQSSNLLIDQRGFTLIEILLAIAIISFVIAAIAPFIKTSYNSWEKDTRLTKILQKGREAMDKMVKELQEAPNLNLAVGLSATSIQYKVADIVVDDGNSGYEESGTWTKYSGTGQGADSREGTGGGGFARWRVPIIVPGNYEIYVFYNATATRPAALTYTINSADVGSPLTSDAV
ncbi:MAG: prepilin-type N-terminal cleavage/methylation domain-containing protein, partial [Actinobacteria bacterium]|nr:prepilin-type N-terminal cleavage/methylation domain-containing protein [Actinomycetota bacterium]